MGAPPSMPFYPTDFLSDAPVMAMTLEERGAYITLLCVAWTEEGLPADPPRLARLCGVTPRRFKSLWHTVGPCFESDGNGRLYSPRMEEVREQQLQRSAAMRKAGRKGAKKRWGGHS